MRVPQGLPLGLVARLAGSRRWIPVERLCLDALQKLGVAAPGPVRGNGPTTKPERLLDWPNQLDPATAVVVNVNEQDKFTAVFPVSDIEVQL
jgi:hypothetical protein